MLHAHVQSWHAQKVKTLKMRCPLVLAASSLALCTLRNERTLSVDLGPYLYTLRDIRDILGDTKAGNDAGSVVKNNTLQNHPHIDANALPSISSGNTILSQLRVPLTVHPNCRASRSRRNPCDNLKQKPPYYVRLEER